MEKNFARPLADSPNIERDRRRSVSEAWTSLPGNIDTDAAASVASLQRIFANTGIIHSLQHMNKGEWAHVTRDNSSLELTVT